MIIDIALTVLDVFIGAKHAILINIIVLGVVYIDYRILQKIVYIVMMDIMMMG